jgi:hypothetical protein
MFPFNSISIHLFNLILNLGILKYILCILINYEFFYQYWTKKILYFYDKELDFLMRRIYL